MADEEQQATTDEGGTVVSMAVICQLLMLSRQRIDQLVKDGWIKRHSPGQFLLVETVQGYIRFMRDETRRHNMVAADSRVRDARARDIETRTQQRLGRLVSIELFDEMIDGLCGVVRSEFAGLPAAVTRELPLRRLIERDVNARLRRIAEHALAEAARVATDRGSADAIGADGTGRVGGSEQNVPADSGGAGTA
jgi:hypothetical protein